MKHYIRSISICLLCVLVCFGVFYGIKANVDVFEIANKRNNHQAFVEATTKQIVDDKKDVVINEELPELNGADPDLGDKYIVEKYSLTNLPYPEPPEFEDDGSYIYYNQETMTDVVNKINKFYSHSYLKNTGYFFAKFAKQKGINPYMLAAITAAEQGCNSSCNAPAIENNNLFGMLYYQNGKLYHCRYNTLEEGLNAFFANVYYLYGLYGYENATYSVEELTNKWNPSGGEHYRNVVLGFMNQIQNL